MISPSGDAMELTLCGANASNMKYYFNSEKFSLLPGQVQNDLKILLVKYCSDVGGAITLSFDEDCNLKITTFEPIDEIDSEIKVSAMQKEHEELFSQLELFARTFLKK